ARAEAVTAETAIAAAANSVRTDNARTTRGGGFLIGASREQTGLELTDHLSAGPGAQRPKGAHVDVLTDEAGAAVGQSKLGTAFMLAAKGVQAEDPLRRVVDIRHAGGKVERQSVIDRREAAHRDVRQPHLS